METETVAHVPQTKVPKLQGEDAQKWAIIFFLQVVSSIKNCKQAAL